jgi:hypothetical protein
VCFSDPLTYWELDQWMSARTTGAATAQCTLAIQRCQGRWWWCVYVASYVAVGEFDPGCLSCPGPPTKCHPFSLPGPGKLVGSSFAHNLPYICRWTRLSSELPKLFCLSQPPLLFPPLLPSPHHRYPPSTFALAVGSYAETLSCAPRSLLVLVLLPGT